MQKKHKPEAPPSPVTETRLVRAKQPDEMKAKLRKERAGLWEVAFGHGRRYGMDREAVRKAVDAIAKRHPDHHFESVVSSFIHFESVVSSFIAGLQSGCNVPLSHQPLERLLRWYHAAHKRCEHRKEHDLDQVLLRALGELHQLVRKQNSDCRWMADLASAINTRCSQAVARPLLDAYGDLSHIHIIDSLCIFPQNNRGHVLEVSRLRDTKGGTRKARYYLSREHWYRTVPIAD